MIASKIQNSAAEFRNFNSSIKEVMVSSRIHSSAVGAADFFILDFGIKEVMVASQNQNSAAAVAEFLL